MPSGSAPGNSLYEIQNLWKLKDTERKLAAILEKIDKEITQTDVEWMHLKSLIESKPTQHTGLGTEATESKPMSPGQNILKKVPHVDDQAVNTIQLDLSLGSSSHNAASLEEEEDSD